MGLNSKTHQIMVKHFPTWPINSLPPEDSLKKLDYLKWYEEIGHKTG